VNEIDTRGSHFYLSLYWAEALAAQDTDADLKNTFSKVYKEMSENEATIAQELVNAQGEAKNVGGYYMPDTDLAAKAMRPSTTLNTILEKI